MVRQDGVRAEADQQSAGTRPRPGTTTIARAACDRIVMPSPSTQLLPGSQTPSGTRVTAFSPSITGVAGVRTATVTDRRYVGPCGEQVDDLALTLDRPTRRQRHDDDRHLRGRNGANVSASRRRPRPPRSPPSHRSMYAAGVICEESAHLPMIAASRPAPRSHAGMGSRLESHGARAAGLPRRERDSPDARPRAERRSRSAPCRPRARLGGRLEVDREADRVDVAPVLADQLVVAAAQQRIGCAARVAGN